MRVTFVTEILKAASARQMLLVLCACGTALNAHGAGENGEAENGKGKNNSASEMLENIRQTATRFAIRQVDDTHLHAVTANAATLDPRLQLRLCSVPLEAFPTGNPAQRVRMTVGVRCTAPNPWTLYVPVHISAMTDVVYTRRAFARGESPAAADLEVRRVALDKLPNGHVRSINQLSQMELVRPLQSGTALTLNAFTSRDMVRQGQEVVIIAEGSGVQVRMAGKAMKNGSSGELIPVRNNNSGRTIEATVLSDGTVRVNW